MNTTEIKFPELQDTEYSLYQVHNIINKILEENNHEKRIVPQMMYNYYRNGLIIKGEKKQPARKLTKIEVEIFVTKYITKILSK